MATRRAAVLGSPIEHSRSPVLHRAAYAALGLDWRYDAIDMTGEALADFLTTCAWPEWAGLSLTMPLKHDVMPLLDDVAPLAVQVAATNTVVFTELGLYGYNTDVAGMQKAISEAGSGRIDARRATILGAGATARSALAALAGMGVREVDVMARDPQKAASLEPLAAELGLALGLPGWAPGAGLSAEVVISTLPPGVADAFAAAVPRTPGVLLDVAYGDAPTALTDAWIQHGGPVADGLDLLLWQAADQVTLMTGFDAPVAAMRAALPPRLGTQR